MRLIISGLLLLGMINLQINPGASQEESEIDFRGITYELQYLDSSADETVINEQQIRADLALLQQLNVNHIRTMGTKYNQDLIPQIAGEYGMSVATGAWISWNSTDSYLEIDRAINVANESELLIIGSGVYKRGEVSKDQIYDYIEYTKNKTDTSVTVSENWQFWVENIAIGLLCDVIMIEIDPLVELTKLSDIGGFVQSIITSVQAIYPTKEIRISTGLPSANHSLASEENQREFYQSLLAKLADFDVACYSFEAFDIKNRQYYTSEGNNGPHWGIFYEDRNPKPVVSDFNEYFGGNIDVSENKIPGFIQLVPLSLVMVVAYSVKFSRKTKN